MFVIIIGSIVIRCYAPSFFARIVGGAVQMTVNDYDYVCVCVFTTMISLLVFVSFSACFSWLFWVCLSVPVRSITWKGSSLK